MGKKIVLVHGLGGAIDKTWGKFPEFLEKDSDLDVEVIEYGYLTPPLRSLGFWKRAPGILNIANALLTMLRHKVDLENDEVILAGHSLGGLIVKKAILRLKATGERHNIKKICFFDVPHNGSGYAHVGKFIGFRNRHLRALTTDSGELDDLNEQWVSQGLDSEFEILSAVADNDDIVPSNSAKSIFRNAQIETINNTNHETIVKPQSVDDMSYVVFKKFILKKNSIRRYRNSASRSFQDWKKLERKHNYSFVSDERRESQFESVKEALVRPNSIVRLTGASGLGKSRILIEAIDAISLDEDEVLYFDASSHEREIRESIRSAVDDKTHGLIVVENCSLELCENIRREIRRESCPLVVVAIGYSHESVEDSIHIRLEPLTDEAMITLLGPVLSSMDKSDVDRVARFAQGYPLLAVLLAEQYEKDGVFSSSIRDGSFVRRLIEGDEGVSQAERDILSACSLFDVFGVSEEQAREEAKFIAEEVAHSTLDTFDRVINRFGRRQIINRAGRYARVVPKPLALTLASEWWEETEFETQKRLINGLPDSLLQSFCLQVSYLDRLHSVKRFSERMFETTGPFGQAEVLLTEKGSRLFRALVEVNPKALSGVLYHALKSLEVHELAEISGDTRRNLVWGLEKLCFHAEYFHESAWCMLLLASAENESWSNNSTGIFSQLFRVHLSGTAAGPDKRIALLDRAIRLGQPEIDGVVVSALEEAVSTYGGSRMIGAEYQGTQAPLKEWEPGTWKEVFEYWESALSLLLSLIDRAGPQKVKAIDVIGHSIRGFVAAGRIEMLDTAIRTVIEKNGIFWPSALTGVKDALEYEGKSLSGSDLSILSGWLDLLDPKNSAISEKLKILVISPPWEHRQNEGGQYIDVAAENAKALATEVAKQPEILYPHIGMLLQGDQKQAHPFGWQLAVEVSDTKELVARIFSEAPSIEYLNLSFISGVLRGAYNKSPESWAEFIDGSLLYSWLVPHYPSLIGTGRIEKAHLSKLIELIDNGATPVSNVSSLGYGSVTEHIPQKVIADFCLELSKYGPEGAWVSLGVIFMYLFGQRWQFAPIRSEVKKLVSVVSLGRDESRSSSDFYHWKELVGKLLEEPDEELAIEISKQLIKGCEHGFNHGDIWTYIKPTLRELARDYPNGVWPVFSQAIESAKGKRLYWLQQLLDRESSSSVKQKSVLSALPIEQVISWCLSFPGGARFAATCVDVLEEVDESLRPTPLFVAILENFGRNEEVARALSANMGTRGWSGSLVPYLEADKAALLPLNEHRNSNVREWVSNQVSYIDRQIARELDRDSESDLRHY